METKPVLTVGKIYWWNRHPWVAVEKDVAWTWIRGDRQILSGVTGQIEGLARTGYDHGRTLNACLGDWGLTPEELDEVLGAHFRHRASRLQGKPAAKKLNRRATPKEKPVAALNEEDGMIYTCDVCTREFEPARSNSTCCRKKCMDRRGWRRKKGLPELDLEWAREVYDDVPGKKPKSKKPKLKKRAKKPKGSKKPPKLKETTKALVVKTPIEFIPDPVAGAPALGAEDLSLGSLLAGWGAHRAKGIGRRMLALAERLKNLDNRD